MLTGDGKGLRRSVIGLTSALVVTLLLLVAQIVIVVRESRDAAEAEELAKPQVPAVPPRPIGNPAAGFGRDAYPQSAMRKGEEGRTVVELTVGRNGRVTRCTVTTSSSRELDRRTCSIARQLRFEPARDASGETVRGTFTLPVRWQLGG